MSDTDRLIREAALNILNQIDDMVPDGMPGPYEIHPDDAAVVKALCQHLTGVPEDQIQANYWGVRGLLSLQNIQAAGRLLVEVGILLVEHYGLEYDDEGEIVAE